MSIDDFNRVYQYVAYTPDQLRFLTLSVFYPMTYWVSFRPQCNVYLAFHEVWDELCVYTVMDQTRNTCPLLKSWNSDHCSMAFQESLPFNKVRATE